jgi:hypothetical protein
MSAGLEQIPTQVENDNMSALCSADFLSARYYGQTSPNWSRRPFLNHPNVFPRDKNGMVAMDVYHDYLVDHPDDAPILLKGTTKDGWMYQHIYFQRSFYMQPGVPRWIRDEVLRRFCTSPYNQIAMREDIEDDLHNRFEEHVFAPPPESMKRGLDVFNKIDVLGAAAVGRRVALAPEALKYLAPEAKYSRGPLSSFSPVERAEIFDGVAERTLSELREPNVIPQRIVTGAIARIGRLVNSELLQQEARLRISQDGTYYPVRTRRPKFYYELSHKVAEKALDELPVAKVIFIDEGEERAA